MRRSLNGIEVFVAGLSAVARADAVVRVLDERGEVTVPELAKALNSPQSSVYRLVGQLASFAWVEPGSVRGAYRLGTYFLKVGAAVAARLDVREVAREPIKVLAESVGSASTLMIHRLGRAVCVDRAVAPSAAVLALQVGDSVPLLEGAGALVLLAFLPSKERTTVLESYSDSGLVGLPDNDELEALLNGIRKEGCVFSTDDRMGTASCAVPIFNHRREVVASLAMNGVKERIADNASALATLRATAAQVSQRIGYEGGLDG
jgi:DNA-binding IclR family transcriptional regulator